MSANGRCYATRQTTGFDRGTISRRAQRRRRARSRARSTSGVVSVVRSMGSAQVSFAPDPPDARGLFQFDANHVLLGGADVLRLVVLRLGPSHLAERRVAAVDAAVGKAL